MLKANEQPRPRHATVAAPTVEPEIENSLTTLQELTDPPGIIGNAMVVHPTPDSANRAFQESVGVGRGQVLPQVLTHALELRREAVLATSVFQPPVTIARLTPIACEPEERERG